MVARSGCRSFPLVPHRRVTRHVTRAASDVLLRPCPLEAESEPRRALADATGRVGTSEIAAQVAVSSSSARAGNSGACCRSCSA